MTSVKIIDSEYDIPMQAILAILTITQLYQYTAHAEADGE
jgi:hypothetical protein